MKRKNIDPFGGKSKGSPPEMMGEINLETNELVERVCDAYNVYRDYRSVTGEDHPFISQLEIEVLNPVQIDLVLQKIADGEEFKSTLGLFLTRLIQDSYDGGYNDFVLSTGDLGMDHFGLNLRGKPRRMLNIMVNGNVDQYCGSNSYQCLFIVEGITGKSCGFSSYCSLFILRKDVGDDCGYQSERSSFFIGGDVGHWCGFNSKSSKFIIEGGVGCSCGHGSEGGVYGTSNPKTYEIMKNSVSEESKVRYKPK